MTLLNRIFVDINSCRYVPDAYYIPFDDWLQARKELEELQMTKERGVLGTDFPIMNYLVAGVPVCPMECLNAE